VLRRMPVLLALMLYSAICSSSSSDGKRVVTLQQILVLLTDLKHSYARRKS
jgi:hypothetical protein